MLNIFTHEFLPPDCTNDGLKTQLLTDLACTTAALNQPSKQPAERRHSLPIDDEFYEFKKFLEFDQPVSALVDQVEQILHFFNRIYHTQRNERVLDFPER